MNNLKRSHHGIWIVIVSCVLIGITVHAEIDVEMQLNNGGFVSHDHFKAELYLNNHGSKVPDAQIFGILDVFGEYFFWPDFQVDVNYGELTIEPGEAYLTFLEFDFPDIDDVIPFGPLNFWGAWFVDMENYRYDVQEFWLDAAHKWTPTPTETPAPSATPEPPFTHTPVPTPSATVEPTATPTPSPEPTVVFTGTPTMTSVPTHTATMTFTPVPSTHTFTPTFTPVPPTFTITPTFTHVPPTSTFTTTMTPTPTATNTPSEFEPGDLYSIDDIVGNMRYVPATDSRGFLQGTWHDEPCSYFNEFPQFTHVLTRSIAVMETELTRQMWWDLQALQLDLPDDPTNESYGAGANNPAQRITWYESVLFANLLSIENGLTPCYYRDTGFTDVVDATDYINDDHICNFDANGYRLPMEAEWEYFCRAGTTGPLSCPENNFTSSTCSRCNLFDWQWPESNEELWNHAVFCANNNGASEPVGSKLGNPWNLKDVHGNMFEWCWDWYNDRYPLGTETDYTGSETGTYRVRRGGDWVDSVQYCRSGNRGCSHPNYRCYSIGARFVRKIHMTPTPVPTPTQLTTATPTMEPTDTPMETPTVTPIPTVTNTPGHFEPGDLYSNDEIVGKLRFVPATGPEGFLQDSPENEPCNYSNEYPQFTHILTRNIAVMETELTRQMWWDLHALRPDLPDDPTNENYGSSSNNPVQSNTWYESVLFANLLSVENGLTPCYYRDSGFTNVVDATDYINDDHYCDFDANGYRLPTEGEWEYFTRAGTTSPFTCDEPNYDLYTCGSTYCVSGEFFWLERYAIFCANADGESEPAGSKWANSWNLKDVHGNVYEWCWDLYDPSYPVGSVTDYAGAETGSNRVLRGGRWNAPAKYCRSAFRCKGSPGVRSMYLGIRFLRSINGVPSATPTMTPVPPILSLRP